MKARSMRPSVSAFLAAAAILGTAGCAESQVISHTVNFVAEDGRAELPEVSDADWSTYNHGVTGWRYRSGPSISRGRIYVGTGSILFLKKEIEGSLQCYGLPGEKVEPSP